MNPARSVAASVVMIGFLTAPPPAFGAPVTCAQPARYAAQSSAELLRIDRLELGITDRRGGGADVEGDGSHGRDGRPGTNGSGSKPSAGGAPGRSSGPAGGAFDGPGNGGGEDSAEGPIGSEDIDGGGSAGGSRSGGAGGNGPGSGGAGAVGGNGMGPSPDSVDARGGRGATKGSGGVTSQDGAGGEQRARTLPAGEQAGGGRNSAIGGVGLGETRSVLIADGPVKSAGAARILDGQVGRGGAGDFVVQQAPPVKSKAEERSTGTEQFGPVRVGPGRLRARAVWAAGMECGAIEGDVSSSAAEISRVTVTGGGIGALVRVPEMVSSRTGTALRQHAGGAQTVASATITAGRISLVDNEVRIRVVRAPELRASMTAGGEGRVDYRPAVVEVSTRNGKQTRLATSGDHVDITLSEEARSLESLPARLAPIDGLPLPKVPGIPGLGKPESSPAPIGGSGLTLRVALGEVRQAASGDAIAARATAIRVTLVCDEDAPGYGRSGVVADLGIGMLEAAAVAPEKGPGQGNPGGTAGGEGSGEAGLPITGPRVVFLFIAGAALVLGGLAAVFLTSRRRRSDS
ncbi:hypothetical protein GCM10010112_36540 [Actinoplanes lobatus]|uniref:Gram-positive cocci surface proteins LPxTG domain-containing protein n=1 Tax=Actinoplanes lobatus TaxID=113568 RepID=A0A7W7MFD2_9ACTN|nr:hypothetical protein [Actinoplanes lobatus]MBB4748217.1 hypothetical protein [Actinoplanes lobatus]GGN70232.1 hypothetical protein GCM10010112_36540 [Actinoplanes lobatus]GIE40066.1 hypothetical protein Alo02nite_29640 [Actinoplanes lobatus]